MRQRDRGTGLRAARDVPELRGRADSDQHFGVAATVHTQPASTPQLQPGSAGWRPQGRAAGLLPAGGQVRG